ncbi:MAG TPA: hypothetical protein VNJ08_15185 [Bacteriovoracaceae bacterium]|nr:hypothetical protein [Bacteriovoracaceae bacterium]
MKKEKVSRMESNKEVRRVLSKHGADMAYCSYSCTGSELRLTGTLIKTDGSEFNGHQVGIIIQEFIRKKLQ